jgi:hypothetical protein
MKLVVKYILVSITLLISAEIFAEESINPIPKISDQWHYSIGVNIWTPAAWVTSSDEGLSKSMYSSISDNVKSAQAISFFTAEARKGDWGVLADLVYVKAMNSTGETKNLPSKQKPPVSVYMGTNLKAVQSIVTATGLYNLYRSDVLIVDGLAGFRSVSVTNSISANMRLTANGQRFSVSSNPSFTSSSNNGVIGMKGRARIYDTSFYVPFYGDFGKAPGSGANTWQAQIGVGNGYSWGDITLTYRALFFSTQSGGVITKTINAGPQLSATFNF